MESQIVSPSYLVWHCKADLNCKHGNTAAEGSTFGKTGRLLHAGASEDFNSSPVVDKMEATGSVRHASLQLLSTPRSGC